VDSLCHPWFTTTNLSYRFPIFETSTAVCGTTGIALIIRCSNCWYQWSLLSAEKAFIYIWDRSRMIINWIYIKNTDQVEIYTQNSESPYTVFIIYIHTGVHIHLQTHWPAYLPNLPTSLPPHTHPIWFWSPWVVKAWKLWFQGCICRQRQDLGMGQWSTGGWVHAHAAAANAENICLLKSACYFVQTGTTVLQQK